MAISEALGQAFIEIRGNLDSLDKDFNDAKKKTDAVVGNIGKGMTSVGKGLTAGLSVPIAAVGVAIGAAGFQFDAALKTIRAGTGATGADLQNLGKDFREVWKSGEEGADEVAGALTTTAQRTGLQGKVLQDLTRQYINFADLIKADVNPLIQQSTGLFTQWGISQDKSGEKLDHLWKVAQTTGVNIQSLMDTTQRFGPLLREMGFSFEEATTMLGHWDKSGVDAKRVMAGLSAASLKLAKDGIPVKEGIAAVVTKIKELGPGSASATMALKVFGKNGLAMRDVILSGAMSFDDLNAAIAANQETINKADDDTDSLTDKVEQLRNTVMSSLAPIGIQLVGALEKMMPAITAVVGVIGKAVEWFAALPAPIQTAVFAIGAVVAAIGPVLMIVGTLISSLGTIVGAWGAVTTAFAAFTPVVGVVIGAFKLLLPFLGPAGWIAAGVTAIFLVWKNWDKITAIVSNVYNGVKTWMVDKFKAIVGSITGAIDTVVGKFKWMYDKVVGSSSVPDMVTGIAKEAKKLDGALVQPVKTATAQVNHAFASTKTSVDGVKTATDGLIAAQRQALNAQMGLTSEHKKGKTATDEYRDALKALSDQLSGKGVAMDAKVAMEALRSVGSMTGLTRSETEQILRTLEAYIEKMQAMGNTTSAEFKRVSIAVADLRKKILNEDYAAEQRKLMNEIGLAQMEADRKVIEARMKIEEDYAAWKRELANEEGLRLMEEDRKRMESQKPFFQKLFNDIFGDGTIGSQIGDAILDAFKGGGSIGKSVGGLVGNKVGDFIGKTIGPKIVSGATKIIGGTAGKFIGGALGSVIPGVGTFIGGMLGDFIGQGLGKVVGKIGGALKSLGGAIKNLFGGPSKKELEGRAARDTVGQALTKNLSAANQKEVAAGLAASDHWKGNEQGLAEAVVLKNAFMAAGFGDRMGLDYADKLHAAVGKGPEAVKKVVDEIKMLLGKFTPKGLMALGFGGIVMGPMPALIGERGPEAVIPLSKLSALMGNMNKKESTPIKDIVQAMKMSGLGGSSVVFSPVFQGTLEHEMKGLIRTKLWPMFLDVLRESGQLRRDAAVVING